MKIYFSKYEGTGNDFILLDNRDEKYSNLKNAQIEYLCDRHFGIGGDGLILLEQILNYDFRMVYYNSDGNISSMCGNGGRCITAFAHELKLVAKDARFVAADGEHYAIIQSQKPEIVKLKMSDVNSIETVGNEIFMDTGSPHYVFFVNDVNKIDVVFEGRKIRYNNRFKNVGTNVNFVEHTSDGLTVRSYERGVENETLSCGTGITASVLAAVTKGIVDKDSSVIKVKSLGGDLNVHFKSSATGFENVWLEGEAKFVFKGEIEI